MSKIRVLRRSPRRSRRCLVRFQQRTCFTVDVGAGGFCVRIAHVLPPGSAVAGTIEMNGTIVPFTGSVAWAQPGEPRLGILGQMGVCFTSNQPRGADDESTVELPLSELRGT